MSLDNIPPTSPLWNLGLDYRPPSSEDADSVSPSSSEFMFENFHTATIDLPGPNIVTNNLPHTPTSQLAEIPATRNKVSDPPESSSVRPHAPPQRLSVLRQGGTASVLDLASLVRSTRDRAQESMEFIGSPPVFNYHPTTSSFDQPPVQPSLNDSAAEQTTNNARNASIETNTPHQTPVRRRLISRLGGVPECGLPLQSGTSYQTPSSTAPSLLSSPCAQPHNLDHKRSLVKATHGRQQIEPRLSSSSPSPNEDGSTRQSPTSDLGRRPHTEEVQVPSSCLPISMEGRRSMGSPKECRSRRSKSQSDSIDGLQERDSFEKVHEPYVVENDDEACTSMSSDAPPEAPARLRSLSGPAPSRPVHPAAAFMDADALLQALACARNL
ncbi:hypothetical protein VP01_543g3 [Puccinia sorghi]|uniref:Uncharacterized protein n=1 Tax=Puccinia sorghi TaxID=27349 RepID=A0A0L6UKE6_9BASI|nr:hypothetical protein VP01_543g3 [Puccinia sorghi]